MTSPSSSLPVVVALTGASGTAYALRLLQVLLTRNHQIELVVSEAARQVAVQETGVSLPAPDALSSQWMTFLAGTLSEGSCASWGFPPMEPSRLTGNLTVHPLRDYSAGIASGSFRTRGMIICPCSTGTLAALACGTSTNLIHRTADVHLKERRPLILVPRETPLSLIALRNMQTVTEAGAVVVPAAPGFYHRPHTIADLVDFVVARVCDLLQIEHALSKRWSESSTEE